MHCSDCHILNDIVFDFINRRPSVLADKVVGPDHQDNVVGRVEHQNSMATFVACSEPLPCQYSELHPSASEYAAGGQAVLSAGSVVCMMLIRQVASERAS